MEPLPCPTFEDAFNAVENGKADLAMIPIENTIAGRVADIHHLLPESRLHIVGEYFLPIHFQLMVLPGVTRSTTSRRSTAISTRSANAARSIRRQWLEAGGRRRHGGRRQARRGRRATARMAALAPRLAATSTGSTSSRRMSRTPKTTSPASSSCRKTKEWAPRGSADET